MPVRTDDDEHDHFFPKFDRFVIDRLPEHVNERVHLAVIRSVLFFKTKFGVLLRAPKNE